MKTFYVESSVKYTDKTDSEPYYGEEIYTHIVTANSNKIASMKASQLALQQFNEELNCGFEDIKVSTEQIYETSEDARCS